MAKADEVEIKFRIEDAAELRRRLRAAGFRLVTPRTHEDNQLYDFPAGRLRRRGELLRLRRYGEQWKLTHKAKGAAGRHKRREETEITVEDGKALAHIFDRLGLQPSFRYEKYRSEFTDGVGHVVLDETPIGEMGEIEGPARWIDRTARKLGLSPAQYITDSYAQLFLTWKKQTGSPAQNMTFRECRNFPRVPRARRGGSSV